VYTTFTFVPIHDETPATTIPDLQVEHAEGLSESSQYLDQHIDASGNVIPDNLPYENLAKRIAPIGEILFFDYGVVVMWGFTEDEERRILDELKAFEEEPLGDCY
jgi:uncharacterized Rmd1/YagE family protein